MIQRNVPETPVPIVPPQCWSDGIRALTRCAATASASRQREDDRRVAEREEEADAERALAVLEELARRVVDRGDVVGVERVAQAERVSERAEPGERRIRRE